MMMHRHRYVVGNWKMQGRLTSGLVLAREVSDKLLERRPMGFDVAICPPSTLIWPICESVMGTPLMVGAQDCHPETHGAYTGDLSAGMFADLGCRFIIVGHSERRQGHGETNALVAQKVAAAQAAGLKAILCVGETEEQMNAGQTTAVITEQIKQSVPPNCRMADLIVAYEPIWAIGTGQQPTVDVAANVHRSIRIALGDVGESVSILYGGSVSSKNVEAFARDNEIDGVLVGSASLNSDGFLAIIERFYA